MTWVLFTLVIAFDALALRHIWSSARGAVTRVGWSALVIAVPLLGFGLWLLCGPRRQPLAPARR